MVHAAHVPRPPPVGESQQELSRNVCQNLLRTAFVDQFQNQLVINRPVIVEEK